MRIIKVIFIIVFYPLVVFFKFLKRLYLKKQLKKVSITSVDSLTGYQFEKFISNVFFAHGYTTKVTPKGADKGLDITASKQNKKIAIQTKMYYNHNVNNSAIQQIYTAKEYFNAHIAVAVTNSYFTKSAIDLALKLHVVLIDRTALIAILKGDTLKNYIY